MADPTMQQVLDELATMRQRMAGYERRDRRMRTARRFLPLALVALLVALMPLSLLAAGPFNDLTGGVHDANIQAIYDAGITKGCVPNVSYCPTANVTREEMASFLARTAGLGSNPPVVNAKTAQTATLATNATHATSADSATNAGNANTVGGYAPNGLLRVARATTGDGSAIAITGTNAAYQQIVAVTLTVPGPGFVLVNGALTGRSTGSACSTNCPVRARVRDAGNGSFSPYLRALVTDNVADIPLAPTYVFSVTTTGSRTFVLEVSKELAGYMGLTASNATLTALYVPFAQDGGTTLAP